MDEIRRAVADAVEKALKDVGIHVEVCEEMGSWAYRKDEWNTYFMLHSKSREEAIVDTLVEFMKPEESDRLGGADMSDEER
jgi:hypothetical protein